MKQYLAWDLEREHGDLGLRSGTRKPPLSSFGMAFRRTMSGTAGRKWVQQIYENVNGSILQAKLALDRTHNASSPDGFNFSPNRIPANVQGLFQSAIKTIESQSTSQHELALKSIAAVGKQGNGNTGITVSRLAALLKGRNHVPSESDVPPHSTEDILLANKGYLTLVPPRYDGEEGTVAICDGVLFRYVNEDYNDKLVMADSQLRTSSIPRSFTRVLPTSDPDREESSLQDIVGELKRFQSPRIMASSIQESPPIRRQSSGLNHSFTLNVLEAPVAAPAPVGLGLDAE
ncbi:hypothetical protein NX059_000639 [Plenodomus lindquistii]|nr:hypothetical protein NX059_000639 [Plenodomus lindquistii]